MSKFQVNDPMVNDKLNAYQFAISAYAAKIELWKAYVRAKSEAYQFAISAYAAKIELWKAYVRAKSEEVENEEVENIDEAPDVPSGRKIAP